jgi:chromosome partitioning protein
MSDDLIKVAVIAQKGGGGKTTLSLNLAVAAAEAGRTVVVIDIDQQANSAKWRRRRKLENVAVVSAPQSLIKETIKTAYDNGADFIILDCPGHNDGAATEAARAADITLIPVKPQMFHLETLPAMRDLVRIAGDNPAWVIINELHPAARTQAEQLKNIIADTYPFPVCPVHLSRLDVFANSADAGLSVLEQEPEGKAAEEIRRVYKFVCQKVEKLESSHVENEKFAERA